MIDHTAAIKEFYNHNLQFSQIPSDLKNIIIADYFNSLHNSWTRQQAEISYLTAQHPKINESEIGKTIQKLTSKPSLESFYQIEQILEDINCNIIQIAIDAIGLHSNTLNLSNTGITRIPEILFELSNYVYFWKNLTVLTCDNNRLTVLNNLQALTSLQSLKCDNNQIIQLDLQGMKSLLSLRCQNNQLISLNLHDLTSLEILICSNNKLTELNLQELTHLTELRCTENPLEVLNLTGVHPNIQDKYQLYALHLKFIQLKNARTPEEEHTAIAAIGPDYTVSNRLYYRPKHTILSFFNQFMPQKAPFSPEQQNNISHRNLKKELTIQMK